MSVVLIGKAFNELTGRINLGLSMFLRCVGDHADVNMAVRSRSRSVSIE